MKRLAGALMLLSVVAAPLCASGTRSAGAAAATPHPLATGVAIDTLRSGGNAVDAATAAAFVLAVADPSAASLGGGGLLLWLDSRTGAVWALDFREIAPRALPDDESRPGANVAVPGFVSGLHAAHERFGALEWSRLLKPAIHGAREGVAITPFVASKLVSAGPRLAGELGLEPDSVSAGSLLVQPHLADTLELVAREPGHLMTAQRGRKLVAALADHGSTLTLADLEEYEPVWRAPIRIDRGTRQIFVFPPPSGGGLAIASMLDGGSLPSEGATASELVPWITRLREASMEKLSRVGDPERTRVDLDVPVPFATKTVAAGEDVDSGSGLVVVDAEGNAAALVFTLGAPFGSGIRAPGGFLMNDSMRDFSIDEGRVPNARMPRRRPATSLTPLLVLERDRMIIAAASGGGSAAPAVLSRFLLDLFADVDPGVAEAAPRYHHPGLPEEVLIERRGGHGDLAAALSSAGQALRTVSSLGAIQAVIAATDSLHAITDSRGGGSTGGY